MKIRLKKWKGHSGNGDDNNKKKRGGGNQETCEKQEWEGIEKYSIKMFWDPRVQL